MTLNGAATFDEIHRFIEDLQALAWRVTVVGFDLEQPPADPASTRGKSLRFSLELSL
jgi:hypothetical protein